MDLLATTEVFKKYAWLIAASIIGSFIGTGRAQGLDTPNKRVFYVVSGTACSLFLAGPFAHRFGVEDPGMIAAIGFIISIFWQQVLDKFSSGIDGISLPSFGRGDKQ